MNNVIIRAENLIKTFEHGKVKTEVLKDINLEIYSQEFVSIIGPSGSGKTTLLQVLSGIESYTDGKVYLFNQELKTLTDNDISLIRQKKIGFVFQFFNLIDNLTVYENILLAKVLADNHEDNIDEILNKVGLLEYKHYYPKQMSGGMQQRVAIARAIINNPEIIFADEPIGNLDYQNGIKIMELFQSINRNLKKTIVLVTHNEEMLKYGTRFIRLLDGRVVYDEKLDK